ncbi:MAG: PD-(D/E)XK nuclease family protein, partial [Kiritimatiellia bacterium]|nr:PD-(D/E)XK nuclease family protein [Kiritimatiellia bacterium]
LAFGNACHAAWQRFGEDSQLRDSTDAGAIAEFLCAAVDGWIANRFGPDPGLAIRLQQDALHARLTAAAAVQALERAAGWRIEQVELTIQLQLPGLLLRGRIDRVDRHEITDACRALDYKTTDKADSPADAHLKTFRDGDPDWTRVAWKGKDKRWADLQLPLYAHALRGMGHSNVVCGYFLLPRAIGETGIAHWEDFEQDLETSAVSCAEEIARRIQKKIYWPPAARPGFDAFENLFSRGVEPSLDPAWVADAKSRAEGGVP